MTMCYDKLIPKDQEDLSERLYNLSIDCDGTCAICMARYLDLEAGMSCDTFVEKYFCNGVFFDHRKLLTSTCQQITDGTDCEDLSITTRSIQEEGIVLRSPLRGSVGNRSTGLVSGRHSRHCCWYKTIKDRLSVNVELGQGILGRRCKLFDFIYSSYFSRQIFLRKWWMALWRNRQKYFF